MAELALPKPLSEDVQKAFEAIRKQHDLRALDEEESGGGSDNLPNGVYGFTYSPAQENYPLFNRRDLRSYEGHKLADGSLFLLGFLTAAEKQTFDSASGEATIHLFAEPEGEAKEMVRVPMTRVLGAVEHSQRGNQGLEVKVSAAS